MAAVKYGLPMRWYGIFIFGDMIIVYYLGSAPLFGIEVTSAQPVDQVEIINYLRPGHFMKGANVYDQVKTFGRQFFQLMRHEKPQF